MLTSLDFWPHSGPRVTLAPFSEGDVDEAWAYRRLPEVTTWTGTWIASRDAWEGFARTRLVGQGLAVRAAGVLVGDAKLAVADGWGQGGSDPAAVARCEAEVGWTIDPRFAGRGLGTELGEELLRIAFVHAGVRRVTASAFADNAPSIRIMEKLGMRREALTVSASFHAARGWIDGVDYAILADEWRARSHSGSGDVSRETSRDA
ncbi:GNAT family N-acetyltransferase [Microbacterium excoecariae]|uniref:GNAT family N-acetyltransferase n=1 Tax=Microbacterium excoecariae TaxID=2715210 RepID=UPI001409C4F3|nr:GNAT family N-acetyltransferase [Microbacterium excoecariae]NHI15880.1 GNAT family N-acetyltransferase [Microbacterium excoecariae]